MCRPLLIVDAHQLSVQAQFRLPRGLPSRPGHPANGRRNLLERRDEHLVGR